jgi:hypothetical protein
MIFNIFLNNVKIKKQKNASQGKFTIIIYLHAYVKFFSYLYNTTFLYKTNRQKTNIMEKI